MALAMHVADLDTSADILRKAVPKMAALDIPVTPENYAVWYEYILGCDLDLKRAIDGLLANEVPFTEDVNRGLYQNFILDDAPEIIESVQLETQLVINNLLTKIAQLGAGTQVFADSLKRTNEALQEELSAEQIQALLGQLSGDMDKVLDVNLSLQRELENLDRELSELKQEMDNLSTAALTDQLTSLRNRRAFDMELEEAMAAFRETGIRASLLLIEVDNFTSFTQTHGNVIGDKVLTYVAMTLRQGVREEDFIARYDTYAFVILLPNTRFHDALQVAEKLRERICEKHLTLGKEKKLSLGAITLSIGLSTLQPGDDMDSFFSRVDRALYRAKNDGKNCVRGD